MSVYNTGTAKLKSGSSIVKGTGTDFVSNVSVGDLFHVTSEGVFYDVASVDSATKLTLSSRYSNSTFNVSVPNEVNASINSATRIYSGTLNHAPVIQNSVRLDASREIFTDNGAGTLTGDQGGSGTLSYDDGGWSITMGTSLTATQNLVASYYYGDELTGVSYQIVKDFTPKYSFPEVSPSDLHRDYIVTKSLRLLDSKLYGGRKRKVTKISADYSATNSDYIILCGGTTATLTVTLPTTGVKNRGLLIKVVNNSATHTVVATVNTTSDKISNNQSVSLTSRYDVSNLRCVATNLWVTE